MTHGSLFSGIGGFDLAAEWMGWDNLFHCELNPFCNKILQHYWPEAESFTDIKKTDFKKYAGKIGIITGGFPCPEFSFAGKGKMGMDLWKEMFRACREIRPNFIIAENVPGFAFRKHGIALDEVCTDLESENYSVIPIIVPAASAGAFHKRDRVWIIGIKEDAFNTNADSIRSHREAINKQRSIEFRNKQICLPGSLVSEGIRNGTDARVFGNINGLSHRVDRIKAAGNAIVPQVALQIFKSIEQYENKTNA